MIPALNLRVCLACPHRKGMTCGVNGKPVTANATADACPESRFVAANVPVATPTRERGASEPSKASNGWRNAYRKAVAGTLTEADVVELGECAKCSAGKSRFDADVKANPLRGDPVEWLMARYAANGGRVISRGEAAAKWARHRPSNES